jgi:hypothetical protein
MGLQVWLITSKQTEPDLKCRSMTLVYEFAYCTKDHNIAQKNQITEFSTSANSHLINIWVVDFVDKANRWRFIRISIR